MTPPATAGASKRIWTYAQIALAALLFMAITQINQTVVTRGLALMGVRTDIPTIVQVNACGEARPTSPLARAQQEERGNGQIAPCKGAGDEVRVDIVTTVPTGQPVSLWVNGARQKIRRVSEARALFRNVTLRPGANNVVTAVGMESNRWDRHGSRGVISTWTTYGWVPRLSLGAPLRVLAAEPAVEPRLIGGWQGAEGVRLLYQGAPDSAAQGPGPGQPLFFGPDGLAIVEAGQAPAGMQLLTEADFRRQALLTRGASGNVKAEVAACLPQDHILTEWGQRGLLSPREFIERITGVTLDQVRKAKLESEGTLNISKAGRCSLIRAKASYPAAIPRRSGGTFLAAPFDVLHIAGFGEGLEYSEPAAGVTGPTFTFRASDADPHQTLDIRPNYDILLPELASAEERPVKAAASRSPLAAAWARVQEGLPVWLQALLYGVVGVAPIILLVLVVQRQAGNEPRPDQAQTLSGLYALLLLALAAAAQPLLLRLFYSFVTATDMWVLLQDIRDDRQTPYLEPYGAVAIAVAVMLVPFLRSATEAPKGKGGVAPPLVCAAVSIALVGALLAAMLLQVLAVAPAREEGRAIALLASLGARPDHVPAITVAVFAAGIMLAWVPVYWAFRAIAPQGRFLAPSLLAGAAAIVLPVFAYLVEAARVAWGSPSSEYGDGGASFLSLVGGVVLPFVLFFLLLRAFREILLRVAPDAARHWIRTYGASRYLLLASLLLVAPELAQDAANPSPADMGIIEILGIFRSLALGVAVFAAVGLVLSYNRRDADADAEPPPHPYQLGEREIALLAALFAGCLGLWTNEPLATLAGIASGWLAFKYIILEKHVDLPPAPATSELAKDLLDHRSEEAVVAARRSALEAKYGKGDISYARLRRERCLLDELEASRNAALGVPPGEAKRWLLEFGPGPTPMANGVRGALAGLLFATMLQLVSSVGWSATPGSLASWADLARAALINPAYEIANVNPGRSRPPIGDAQAFSPDLLTFVGTLLNTYFLWIVLGFLFGFLFHRIRGDDGFVKAFYFSLGVGTAFFMSLLFTMQAAALHPIRFVPVVFFLLFVGVAVFDARSLSSRKQSPAALLGVYGLRTSLGYVSLLGAIATIEPILGIVRGLFTK